MIYLPNASFDFSKLYFISPTTTSNGNIIKIRADDAPLYVQTPKCMTKSAFQKSGKKMYCDLLFTIENETFIQWLEKLEGLCIKQIFDNKDKWFKTELAVDDIENSFTSSLKIYKSGKFYILKTIVPTLLGNCDVNIYNEKEELLTPDVIQENTNIISILEVTGIRCTSRNFSIDFEMKQIMYVEPVVLFNKCILKPTTPSADVSAPIPDVSVAVPNIENTHIKEEVHTEAPEQNENVIMADENVIMTDENEDTNMTNGNTNTDTLEQSLTDPILEDVSDSLFIENDPIQTNEIMEIDFDLDKLPSEEVQLKPRNDIYYEMYKEARKKAKMARDLALSSYLEAKKIKNTYMLEKIDDSDNSEIEDLQDI